MNSDAIISHKRDGAGTRKGREWGFNVRGEAVPILQVMRGRKPHLTLANRFVVFGGIAKALHYLGENYGVMRGFSYGTVGSGRCRPW